MCKVLTTTKVKMIISSKRLAYLVNPITDLSFAGYVCMEVSNILNLWYSESV
jgi:hypothetical protein